MAKLTKTNLRTLGTFSIWAIGVGLVISGESFGWNNGWRHMGIYGFMLPVVLVSILYYVLVRCNIELACVYPDAEGPHNYSSISLGNDFGRFVAFATLVEFLFASPAIANTIGEYIQYLSPNSLNARWIATAFILLFCVVNLFKIQISTIFVILLTILAIVELLIYFFSVGPTVELSNISNNNIYNSYNFNSLISALPFAIWLYLGIEGINLITKNVKKENYRKHISGGYYTAFWTLLILVFAVLIIAGGSTIWTNSNWSTMTSETNGHPLPLSLEFALGKENYLVQIFTFLGLFGLIASLQGIVLASMQQIQSLLKLKNSQITSSIIVAVVSLISIWSQTTSFLIELSVFGAVCMYLFNGLSLLNIRWNNKNISDFKVEGINVKHEDFNRNVSLTSSTILVVLSLFCATSLIFNHVRYFFAFCIIATIYILLDKKFNN